MAAVIAAAALAACGNPAAAPARPLIFIPGFAGSELVATETREVDVTLDDGSTRSITLHEGDKVWPHFSEQDWDLTTILFDNDYYRVLRLEPDRLGLIAANRRLVRVFYPEVEPFFERNGYRRDRDLYLFGWDWRRSPADAAAELSRLVGEVLDERDVDGVDIVAHSIGSAVLRWFMLTDPLRSRVVHAAFLADPGMGIPASLDALIAGSCLRVIPIVDHCVVPPSIMRYVFATSPGSVAGATSSQYLTFFDGTDAQHPLPYVREGATPAPGEDPASYEYLRGVMRARGVSAEAIDVAEAYHATDRLWLPTVLRGTNAKIAIGGGSGSCATGQLREGSTVTRSRIDGDTMVPRQSALFGEELDIGYEQWVGSSTPPGRLTIFVRPLEHGAFAGFAGLPLALAFIRDEAVAPGQIRPADCGG